MPENKQNSIPAPIMDALSSPEITRSVQEIGVKLHLHVDQQGDFIDLVTDLILGVIKWEDFKKVVGQKFDLTDEQKQYVIGEVEKKVLDHISSSLHSLYKESEAEKDAEAQAEEAMQTKPANPYRTVDPYREPID